MLQELEKQKLQQKVLSSEKKRVKIEEVGEKIKLKKEDTKNAKDKKNSTKEVKTKTSLRKVSNYFKVY